MRAVLSTRRVTDGRRNRDRSSKRNLLVSHCCLFRASFGGLPMAVPAGPGIQELDPVDVDQIPVVLGSRLLVVPRLRTLPAFEINPASFMQVLADDLCQAIEGFHSKPLRVLLRGAALVLPSFRGRDGKLRYGCSLLAVFHIRGTAEISDQHYFLHLLLLLLLSVLFRLAATSSRLCFHTFRIGSRFRSAPSANRRYCRRAHLPSESLCRARQPGLHLGDWLPIDRVLEPVETTRPGPQ